MSMAISNSNGKVRNIQDAILNAFQRGVVAQYGNRLTDMVLFGARVRIGTTPDGSYHVAIFLNDMADKQGEIDRLDTLRQEMLDNYNVEFQVFPFNAGDRGKTNGMIKAVCDEGVSILQFPQGTAASRSSERLNSVTGGKKNIVCLSIEALTINDKSYPLKITLAEVMGEKRVQEWLVRPADEWLDEECWPEKLPQLNGMWFDDLIFNGYYLDALTGKLSGFFDNALILSENAEADTKLLTAISRAAKTGMFYHQVEDFQDKAWQIAQSVCPNPAKAYQEAELAAAVRYPDAVVQRNAEMVRGIIQSFIER